MQALSSRFLIPALSLVLFASVGCSGGDSSATDGGQVNDGGIPDGTVTDATPDATPDAAVLDCDNLTALPVAFTALTGFSGSEDFAFDMEGNLVSNREGNMTRQPKTGSRTLLSPNIGETAGTRYLSNGDLVVAQVDRGELWRIRADGSQETLLSGLVYPNGVEVDESDVVYVSELDAGRIRRYDVATGTASIIATGLQAPNGISFSPDYQTLYVASFGGGTVHQLTVDAQGTWSQPTLLGSVPKGNGGKNNGGLDALTVDGCGNVYITEFIQGVIWRFSPEGVRDEVVKLPSFWIPNMHWGSGIGGWDENILYVMDREQGRVFELDLGIVEKDRVYP